MTENKNVLWVQNPGRTDIILGDLNVKVCVGKTVNIYKANPYLTPEKVTQSIASGSLYRMFATKMLKQVKGPAEVKPPQLDQLKDAKKTVVARKTKTSVIIDPTPLEEEGAEEKGFEFADYGVSDAVKHEKDGKGAVVVQVQQDALPTAQPKSPTTKDIIENLQKNAVNPMGPVAKMAQPSESFVVVDNKPQTQQEEPSVVSSSPTEKPIATKNVAKTKDGMVVVGSDGQDPPRSLKAIVKGTQDTEMIPDDDVDGADKVIEGLKEEGMRIATKTDEGVVVMQVSDDGVTDNTLTIQKTVNSVVKKPRTSKKT